MKRNPPETQNEIIDRLRKKKSDLKKKYPIKTLYLFGSYSKNEQTENSDVDIMVELKRPIGFDFVHLAEELEKILQKRVDVVSSDGIEKKKKKYIEKDLKIV